MCRVLFLRGKRRNCLMKRNDSLYRMIISALMVALGWALPFVLGNVQILEQGISPMHIPAMIAGLTCGPVWGLAVGFVTPILRSVTVGMPPMPMVAVPMAFELAVYGGLSGLMYPLFVRTLFRKDKSHIAAMVLALLVAMILGRFVGGAAKAVVMGMNGKSYGWQAFITAYFVTTAVGAVIHLIVVPAVTFALERSGLSPVGKELKQ